MKNSSALDKQLKRVPEADRSKIHNALNVACGYLPHLSGLAAIVDIRVDSRVETACIFPSGRMLISPEFLDAMNVKELAFILAHELLHLEWKTHERQGKSKDGSLINIAHDFLINELLSNVFGSFEVTMFGETRYVKYRPPMGGLDWSRYRSDFEEKFPNIKWKPVSEYSLEELVVLLKPLQDKLFSCWNVFETLPEKVSRPAHPATLGDLLAEAGITTRTTEKDRSEENSGVPKLEDILRRGVDVLPEDAEFELFPDANPVTVQQNMCNVREVVVRSYAEQAIQKELDKATIFATHGREAGGEISEYQLLRGAYRTPWEAALQRWFDAIAPRQRSWARPSRRGAFRTDVVLPGRAREGWILHIVLDTSGSMDSELSSALGAIDHFCQGAGVEVVHILQCDVEVTSDEFVELGDLEHFQGKGFGYSDMSPAMLALAEDPDVEAVLVITDGYIIYPAIPCPTRLCGVLRKTPPWNSHMERLSILTLNNRVVHKMILIEELIEYCISRGLLTLEQLKQLQKKGLYSQNEPDILDCLTIPDDKIDDYDDIYVAGQRTKRSSSGKRSRGRMKPSRLRTTLKAPALDELFGKKRTEQQDTWESDFLIRAAARISKHAGIDVADLYSTLCKLNHLSEDVFQTALIEALNERDSGHLTLNDLYKIFLNPDISILNEYDGPAPNACRRLFRESFNDGVSGKYSWILKYENIGYFFHLIQLKRRLLKVVKACCDNDFSTFERWSSDNGRLKVFDWKYAKNIDTTSLKIATIISQVRRGIHVPNGDDKKDINSQWYNLSEIGALLLLLDVCQYRNRLLLNNVEYVFCWCSVRTFIMGSPIDEPERGDNETQHEVTLTRGFWMLETPVTQEMWESVMGNNPSHFKGSRLPVEQVSWGDCQEYIKRLNSSGACPIRYTFRLPSEAEWEYACRAGTTGAYGGTGNLNGMGWYRDNS